MTNWHSYSQPGGPLAHDRAPTPLTGGWWFPAITVYGGLGLAPMHTVSMIPSEAGDYITRQLCAGHAVEVWDATPTCASRQRFAAGPCSPLTCSVGRPLRGSAPRYH